MAITKRKNGYLFSYSGNHYIDVYNDKGEVVKEFIYAPAMSDPKPWNFAHEIARWEAGWGTVAEAYRRLSQANFRPVKPRRKRKTVPSVAVTIPATGSGGSGGSGWTMGDPFAAAASTGGGLSAWVDMVHRIGSPTFGELNIIE